MVPGGEFKRMGQIVADSIHAAAAHDVKLKVWIEIDANRAHRSTWHVRTRVPAVRRTTITNEARRVLALRWHVRSSLAKGEWNQADS